MEHYCWENAQYSRRECLDVIGISSELDADVLEEKDLNIFGEIGRDVPPKQIDS